MNGQPDPSELGPLRRRAGWHRARARRLRRRDATGAARGPGRSDHGGRRRRARADAAGHVPPRRRRPGPGRCLARVAPQPPGGPRPGPGPRTSPPASARGRRHRCPAGRYRRLDGRRRRRAPGAGPRHAQRHRSRCDAGSVRVGGLAAATTVTLDLAEPRSCHPDDSAEPSESAEPGESEAPGRLERAPRERGQLVRRRPLIQQRGRCDRRDRTATPHVRPTTAGSAGLRSRDDAARDRDAEAEPDPQADGYARADVDLGRLGFGRLGFGRLRIWIGRIRLLTSEGPRIGARTAATPADPRL